MQIVEMLVALPAILIALTFHEYAHGKVVDLLGDDTPYYQGRLTLTITPYRLDRLCHVIYISLCWAKPVQVNPNNFRNVGYKKV